MNFKPGQKVRVRLDRGTKRVIGKYIAYDPNSKEVALKIDLSHSHKRTEITKDHIVEINGRLVHKAAYQIVPWNLGR